MELSNRLTASKTQKHTSQIGQLNGPMSNLNVHKIKGVEHFNRDEHYIYLFQQEQKTKGPAHHYTSRSVGPLKRARELVYNRELSRGTRLYGKRVALATFLGSCTIFAIAATIATHW